jgi:hypothetical protein
VLRLAALLLVAAGLVVAHVRHLLPMVQAGVLVGEVGDSHQVLALAVLPPKEIQAVQLDSVLPVVTPHLLLQRVAAVVPQRRGIQMLKVKAEMVLRTP